MSTGAEPPIDAAEFERRIALLSELHALAALPVESLSPLVAGLREEHHPAGRVLVSDVAAGARRFVILAGQAEVAAPAPNGLVPLGTLGPGELFGEAPWLEPDGGRRATIIAQSDLHVLSLDGTAFEQLVAQDPIARAAFAWITEHRMTARFLKLASPFAALTATQARDLSRKIRREAVSSGATVFRQGEEGDTAYLVMTGRLQVVLETGDGTEKPLATMGPGMLFGETALLNRAPRNATVRADEPCELLVLSRDDIVEAMGAESAVRARMLELLHERALPRQADGLQVHERLTPEGQTIRVLKDPIRGRYYRLSPQGWFLWQRLDGQHTLHHLRLAYVDEYKFLNPLVISDVLSGLAAVGFITVPELAPEVLELDRDRPLWQRAWIAVRGLAAWALGPSSRGPRR